MPKYDDLEDNERLWLLSVAHTDISQAAQAAGLIIAMPGAPEQIRECLHDALIVRYARCFRACEMPGGKGRTKLPDRCAVVDGLPPELHLAILDNRDKIVAHSDMSAKEVVIEKKAANGEFVFRTSGIRFNEGRQMQSILELCLGILRNIEAEARPIANALLAPLEVGTSIDLREELTRSDR